MESKAPEPQNVAPTRRDFLYLATAASGAVGMGAAIWPMITSLNPSADVVALASVEVDLAPMEPGQRITVRWRGRPVFIVRRTAEQIARDKDDDPSGLRHPEPVTARLRNPDWLIVIGVCPHLGCIPLGQKSVDPRGDYGGWYCPCHGSVFDSFGRIRRGPAPRNLVIPPYVFLAPDRLRIG